MVLPLQEGVVEESGELVVEATSEELLMANMTPLQRLKYQEHQVSNITNCTYVEGVVHCIIWCENVCHVTGIRSCDWHNIM